MSTINRYLSYAVAKDIVPTLKTFLSSRGSIIADERTNSLIISDIPNRHPECGPLDQGTRQEDTRSRDRSSCSRCKPFVRARHWHTDRFRHRQRQRNHNRDRRKFDGRKQRSQRPRTIGSDHYRCDERIRSYPALFEPGAVGPTSGLIFNNIGARYRVDAILTMAESRGLIKILSRPRVVTQNNIPAIVKQGIRIPIVTLAQLGGPPTTTYVDAFLRLAVKPQITAEGTIFLNVDVENTTADFSRQVQGNPTLVTEQATTQVLITDGGTVVIGGVIQTNNNVGISQVPLLGNIPVFGNLFKRRNVSTSVQELIFFITPKIVQT